MITDAFMRLLLVVLEPMVGGIPQTEPLDLPSVYPVAATIHAWDYYFPIKGPLAILAVWLLATLSMFAIRAGLRIWQALPFT